MRANLVNDSDRPHTFSVDALDLSVYVPAGRTVILDVALPPGATSLDVYCGIGDHREIGMIATIELAGA